MPERTLRGCRILLVEDEYMLADELRMELSAEEAIVVGPAGTIAVALDLIRSDQPIDGGILDVNLGGEMVFPVADDLSHRGVPFLFTTGYDQSTIPARFAAIERCDKPITIKRVTQAIRRLIHA